MIKFEWHKPYKELKMIEKDCWRLPELVIRLGGFVDFRQWYEVMYDDGTTRWVLEYELEECLDNEDVVSYKKIPLWKSIFR